MKEPKFVFTFHEPNITKEENEKRFEKVVEVLEKIAKDMIKNGVTLEN